MKILLDTSNEVIKIEEDVNIEEFFKILKALLPNGLWKKYSLNTNSTIYWANPIVINQPIYPMGPLDSYPVFERPWITYTNGVGDEKYTQNATTISGSYCIELSSNG